MTEIRYDSPELDRDATEMGRQLDKNSIVSCHYAAFGTGHVLMAVDQELIDQPEVQLHDRGPNGISSGGYTLWLRERGNHLGGPWLKRGVKHVPPYLAEKFDLPLVDCYGLAVLILLVDSARIGRRDAEVRRIILDWSKHVVQVTGREADALPAFMGGAA